MNEYRGLISDTDMMASDLIYNVIISIGNGQFNDDDFLRLNKKLSDQIRNNDYYTDMHSDLAAITAVYNLMIGAIPMMPNRSLSYQKRTASALELIFRVYPNLIPILLVMRNGSGLEKTKQFIQSDRNGKAIHDTLVYLKSDAKAYVLNIAVAVLTAMPEGFYKNISLNDSLLRTLHSIIGERLLKENPKHKHISRICIESDLGL